MSNELQVIRKNNKFYSSLPTTSYATLPSSVLSGDFIKYRKAGNIVHMNINLRRNRIT